MLFFGLMSCFCAVSVVPLYVALHSVPLPTLCFGDNSACPTGYGHSLHFGVTFCW